MQRLEVSGVVRLIYRSLGVKGFKHFYRTDGFSTTRVYLDFISEAEGIALTKINRATLVCIYCR